MRRPCRDFWYDYRMYRRVGYCRPAALLHAFHQSRVAAHRRRQLAALRAEAARFAAREGDR